MNVTLARPVVGQLAPSRFRQLAVAGVEPVAADGSAVVVTLTVPAELRPEFRFRAGQHVTVGWRDGELTFTPQDGERAGVAGGRS